MKNDGSRSASSMREPDRAVRSLLARRLDDLGAVEPEQTAALGGDVRGEDAGQRIAAQPCGERERDARVAARRLEQAAARLELAGRLGRIEHRLRDAVLDRPARVLPLELRVETDGRLRREAGQLDERRRPDEVEERRRKRCGLASTGHGRQEDQLVAVRAPRSRVRRACGRPRRRRRRSRTARARRPVGAATRAAGSARSRSSITSATVEPSASSSRAPPTSARSVGGMRTAAIRGAPVRCRTRRSRRTR